MKCQHPNVKCEKRINLNGLFECPFCYCHNENCVGQTTNKSVAHTGKAAAMEYLKSLAARPRTTKTKAEVIEIVKNAIAKDKQEKTKDDNYEWF